MTITDQDYWWEDSHRTGLAEVEAILKKRNPALGSDPHLAWETISTTLLGDNGMNPRKWRCEVELDQPLGSAAFRILLQEYEWYRSDFNTKNAFDTPSIARSVVYADAFLICWG